MKDYALELASSRTGADEKFNILREYLQSYVLRIMQDFGAFRSYFFVGGTALRFLYDLPRFSEDLDFSLARAQKKTFAEMMAHIKKELQFAGYDVDVSYNDEKTVHWAMLKFPELMHAAGLSGHKTQKLSVKLEIDTNPPLGAQETTKIVNKYFPLSFLTHDLSSLFSGKLHALLIRKYSKGRDFYDVGWYLSRFKDLKPNIVFLRNALTQTGWARPMPEENSWREFLYNVVKEVDWEIVNRDVRSFLERPKDMEIFTKENILSLISGKG